MYLTDLAHNCVAERRRTVLLWVITQRVVAILPTCRKIQITYRNQRICMKSILTIIDNGRLSVS